MMQPLIAAPGAWEIALIILVILLFFGAAKLPELARGTGRALRIFKSETRGLLDDDDETPQSGENQSEQKKSTAELNSAQSEDADDIVSPKSQRDTSN